MQNQRKGINTVHDLYVNDRNVMSHCDIANVLADNLSDHSSSAFSTDAFTSVCNKAEKLNLNFFIYGGVARCSTETSILQQYQGRERNVLFNDALNTFYLRLYGVRHMVKHHSDSEKGNPLPPHRLLLSINSKGSFISIIPPGYARG